MSCGCAGHDPDCTCCQGVTAITPMEITNRPGLDALRYRVGTHARFFETMQAKLSSAMLEVEQFDDTGKRSTTTIHPLEGLTTRECSDPAIAVLDAWATVADVLSFYTERVANEGYLRTATERRSVLEIARLVGYAPRPGVAASVYLAYTLEDGHEDVTLKAGTRAQSVPAPGELPQSFETSEDFVAQARLSAIRPRLTRPQLPDASADAITLYLKGVLGTVSPGQHITVTYATKKTVLYQVKQVTPEAKLDRTVLELQRIGALARDTGGAESVSNLKLEDFDLEAAFQVVQKKLEDEQPAGPNAAQFLQDFQAKFASGNASLKSLEDAEAFLKAQLSVYEQKNYGRLMAWLKRGLSVLESILEALKVLQGLLASDETNASARKAIDQVEDFTANARKQKQLSLTAWLESVIDTLRERFDFPESASAKLIVNPISVLRAVGTARSLQPANSLRLDRGSESAITKRFSGQSDLALKLYLTLNPQPPSAAYAALETATRTVSSIERTQRIALTAGLYGNNAPPVPILEPVPGNERELRVKSYGDPDEFNTDYAIELKRLAQNVDARGNDLEPPNIPNALVLDALYDQIKPGSRIVIVSRGHEDGLPKAEFHTVQAVYTINPRRYGLSTKVTALSLDQPWQWVKKDKAGNPILDDGEPVTAHFGPVIQNTVVHVLGETVELIEEPITTDVGGASDQPELELDGLYRGLEPGRWVIVQGERVLENTASGEINVLGPSGAVDAELAMIASVTNPDATTPGDGLHTFIRFASPLKWRFKRETVTVFGNVVRATHGETRAEVLGAGDATRAFQRFELKQPPLTYLAAPTATGAASTLELRVDGLKWLEAAHLAGLGGADRRYTLRTDDDGKTSAVFGDGVRGARLPTGRENVTATYRNGIGKPGNVGANRISLLASRPLGVKGVINPIRASGGADRESRDQARRNAPLAVMALDRLVSVQDYQDFARTFAGIGKAKAAPCDRCGRALVYLTIAGADDIPILESSDLYRNLLEALRLQGDPDIRLQLAVRELRLLVVNARVRLLPEYAWERVEPRIRARMLEYFGFDARELGQDATSSEVLGVIQAVPGVAYVDLGSASDDQGLGWVDRATSERVEQDGAIAIEWATNGRVPSEPARVDDSAQGEGSILPAQLVFLSPNVPDTLILTEIR